MITALLIGAGALWLLGHKRNGVSGIGAARKRRIYKELSLAQQAGVDFTKPYDELTEDEIAALQQVSNDTGYTETYYKSLQKAYNAISGIGEAYDVVDADGNTVLTWIEDPENQPTNRSSAHDDKERYRALREAHDIEDDMQWAATEQQRERDEREARLAEQRKRIKKAGRTSQMALFGCGTGALNTRDLLEPSLIIWLNRNIDRREINDTSDEIMESREPLYRVNSDLEGQIIDLVNQWCDNTATDPESIWSIVDPEDIFWAL